MSADEYDFTFGEELIADLHQEGFVVKARTVRKTEPKQDYTVNFRGKPVIEILPRKNCHFKCKGIITDGKLVTVRKKQDIEDIKTSLLEFRDEVAKKEDFSKEEQDIVAVLERYEELAKVSGDNNIPIKDLKHEFKKQWKEPKTYKTIQKWIEKKGYKETSNNIILVEAKHE